MTLAPEIDVRESKGRSANVVLGEDWENPASGSDGELSARRARRGFISLNRSALARKIITFNLLALIILVAGVLYLNPVRSSLVEQRDAALVAETALVASVFEAQLPASAPVNFATGDGIDVQRTLDALSLAKGTEAFVFDANGALVGRATGENDPLAEAGGTRERSTLITDFLNSVWHSISGLLGPDDQVVDAPEATAEDMARALLPAALEQGQPAQRTQEGEGGERFAVVAPVMQNGKPVGAVALTSAAGEIDRLVRQDREQVLQMFVVALLVSIGLSLALASTIANPLSDLAEAAELGRDRNARKMSPNRIRIPDLTARPDEIGRLSGALRGMVTALYDRIDANEQFAADVAHEIKNPLASLRSAVGTLRVAKREDQREKLLDVIDHDVRRLDRLVSDISNASRLDSELVREEEEAFDLLKMLGNINEYLGNEARSKGIEFISDLPAKPIIVMGLEARLAQVFVNLITNAISFCEEGDAIRVWARKRENRVLIVVEDTGPGIPDQALHKIFNRFYSERPPGQFGNNSGLGLAISKQIVEAHDGVIWAENIRPTEADVTSEPLGALRGGAAGLRPAMTEADRTLQSRLQRALDTGAPVHASAVALHGRALLILGRSGSGKSTLALQLMAHGAGLLADDGALLAAEAGGIRIGCPAAIRGRIEARGLGLLEAPAAAPARLHAVVDLDAIEADRLPEPRALTLSGHSVSLFSKVDGPHFAPALLLVLRAAGAGEKENAQ